MFQNWSWVVYSLFDVTMINLVPSVNVVIRHWLQFWDPSFDVCALRVIVDLLGPRIEYSEIGLSISSITHCPLPASGVLHGTVVDKFWGKVSFALVPIQEEILCKERCDNHSASIMHETCSIELSHGSIDDREAGLALFPGFQLWLVIFPLNLVEFALERVLLGDEHSWKIVSNIHIEISPVELVDNVVF